MTNYNNCKNCSIVRYYHRTATCLLACFLSFFSIHSILLPGILPIFPHSSVAAISKLSTSAADRTKNYHTQHTIIYFRHSVLCPLIVEKSGFFSKIYYHQFLLTYRLITNIWALRFPHLLACVVSSPFAIQILKDNSSFDLFCVD